ncbi:type IV toxin-antitoxin system AbiEi family antitoxin [Actinoplanes sp. CA-131856]
MSQAFSFVLCSNKLNGVKNRTQAGSAATERFLELARQRLQEFGITLDRQSLGADTDSGADAVVTLSRGDVTAKYLVQVKPMTLTALAHGKSLAGPHSTLVIGNRISRRSADAFREANIQFVDTLGNASIRFGDVFVDVRGRVEQDDQASRERGKGGAGSSVNLFSRGRAQVILALLTWPELVSGGRREIAGAAGTSLGQAHDVMTRLAEAGFLLPSSHGLVRVNELIDYWTAAYSTGLGRRLGLAEFHGDPSSPIKSERPLYFSGETAVGVDLARPATSTVYLDVLEPKLAIANRWSANPDRIPNIFVRKKFWTSPHPAEEDPARKTQNAPWLLVYADLMATADARLAEVARKWRADHARSDEG